VTNILILYTGGTIGMTHDPDTGTLRPFDFKQVVIHLPELRKLDCHVDFHTFKPLRDSSDMQPDVWVELAVLIEQNYKKYDGFVILHGTDTMAYTASALSFMLENLTKPVVLTGSQLPYGAIRTDARRNLITAVEIAGAKENGKPVVPEVSLFFNNQLFRGNRVEKYTSSRFDAFQSSNYPALADSGVHLVFNHENIRKPGNGKLKVHKQLDTNIALLKIFPGIHRSFMDAVIGNSGLKALVLETYGSGNAPTSKWFLGLISKAVDNGMVVLNVSQCSGGSVEMGKYETSLHLKKAGVVSGYDMTTEAALTKLMFLLGQGFTNKKLKDALAVSLRGELHAEQVN